ncbi:MAG: hypothetical protein C5B50_25470 [Verrucomicrobia bacterium]|nr:MAG: hypothetical protein C5B50_25470 [Verrucomicrobiota bacterium]
MWSPAGRLSTPAGNYSQSTRHGDFFQGELAPNNTTGAVWIAVTNLAVLQNGTSSDLETTNVGNIFVPKTPETFSYDADGNMTSDGRFTVAWDAENRAISFTSLTNAPDGSKVKVDCAYDDRGRRIQKVVSAWSGSNYVAQSTNRFVYDGWNLIGILNSTNGLLYSFTWGTDLSGTMQGAGGVGGLISMTVHSGTSAGTYFYVFDGNGNVVALVNAGDGSIAAQCEYGPFGELLRATGPMAKTNPFRFSTKYEDDETDLLYYGRRYYTASTGRWLDRDPLMEAGGKNLYAFVLNAPVSFYDPFGLEMPVWEGPMFQPPPAPPPAPTNAPTLPDAMRACCDEKSRQKGENELNRRYNRAVAKAGVLNLLPAALGKPGASCVNSSSDILRWLAPFPKCWVCYLENRDRVDYNILRHDHQVVVCRGYTSASTAPREIMFDWWGDTENTLSRSGGSPDPFRQEYPLGPWVTPERYTGAITDCSGNPIDPRLHQDCSFGACLAGLRGQ